MTFVLDASVTLCWLFLDGKPANRDYALKTLDSMKDAETKGVVPATWGLEVANVIAKAEIRELLSEAQSEAFLEMLNCLDISADAATASRTLSDTIEVARRYRLSAYDASYLELALRLGLPLATLDQDLRKAAHKAGVRQYAAS